MATQLEVVGPRQGSAPLTYTLSELGTVDFQTAFASFDGTGASGSFEPVLTVRSQNGTIVARSKPSTPVAAGASADVSWFPGVNDQAAGGSLETTDGVTTVDPTDILSIGAGLTLTEPVAGTAALAVTGNVFEWDAVITKTADESVTSSITLQNDDELFFTTVDGAVYVLQAVIVYASPAGGTTPGMRVAWGEDTTQRGAMLDQILTTTPVASAVNNMTDQAFTPPEPTKPRTNTFNQAVYSYGWHTGHGGTFRFLWAQLVSDANATIVRAGSYLAYRRIT